jgi:type III restriction enzyme
MPFLYEEIESVKKFGVKQEIPTYISANLNKKIVLRDYQIQAIENFLINENSSTHTNKKHLLWHMATGSGKTVIMASMIIYYYNQGYRNFLFFVNQTNIIEKTKFNFINSGSNKYLFNNKIEINGSSINIKEVSNFDQSDKNSINIAFYTIQKLQSDLFTPAEDHINFDDLRNNQIIMISDESHHLNSQTKKGKRIVSDDDNS